MISALNGIQIARCADKVWSCNIVAAPKITNVNERLKRAYILRSQHAI